MSKKTNFEIFLEKSRYVIIIPVISLFISSVFLFVWTIWDLIATYDVSENIVIELITAFDTFLLGVIALVFSVSLYEIYVKEQGKDLKLPVGLTVNNIHELKDKMAKIIYLVLLITFFKFALSYDYDTIEEIVGFAFAIFLISLSVYFTNSRFNR